ncbi:hypothetical protein SDC9_87611 [bioreactor metagenome]|uniref:DUF3575 domain-containing protein n=1 Tax=bioreactor metagenome TaxID=1076179 RepID=A0A644ZJB7_9ZZZZ
MMYKLKRLSVILFLTTGLFFSAYAQKTSIKTNIPYWFTASPNLGVEFALGENLSFEFSGGFNPFKFGDNKQMKHWIVWPELRYWLDQAFDGHFFGIHGVGGQYNIGGLDLPSGRFSGVKTGRYQGSAIGLGLSYGYKWILNDRWGIEVTLGGGFARFNYDIYSLGGSGQKTGENTKNYFGPTKGAISFVYLIN